MSAHTQSTAFDGTGSRGGTGAHDWRFSEQKFLISGTLLHLAVLRESRDMVLLLLGAGASPSRKGAWLWTGGASSPIYGTYVLKESLTGTPLVLATGKPGGETAEFPSPIATALANWSNYALLEKSEATGLSVRGGRYSRDAFGDAGSVTRRSPESSTMSSTTSLLGSSSSSGISSRSTRPSSARSSSS
ncbi:uncharacterized protein AMSG_11998 [Thecamonas trahens ATCC 50062]|uniref:Uncharacterized protein n=1 Tax=Thecamonas trahens ATCC 50062 TaxID=461836 RepID=A0A0L0DEH6_THETB|nr:hypothetical protein AMSG_11998 [Thecamonas trahens ATCC 50062]KNC50732.1 hypothetical protein AMSG_11998 [Thecamonas trahens ATCC 50062]|eukprot:XP_013756819.1 hypothetical protein AMSG_11998 [Thecamonas trahens ATCC 50062]